MPNFEQKLHYPNIAHMPLNSEPQLNMQMSCTQILNMQMNCTQILILNLSIFA